MTKTAKFLIEFFADAVSYLNIPEFTRTFHQSCAIASVCPIINAIPKYENHTSVTKIGNKQAFSVTFSFSLMEKDNNSKNTAKTEWKENLSKIRYSVKNS